MAGHNIEDEPVEVKRKIGVVPEQMALFDRLTGPEYLRFVGRMYGMPREVIDDRSGEAARADGAGDPRVPSWWSTTATA